MCKFHKSKADCALAFHDLIWDQLKIKLDAVKVADMEFDTNGHPSVGFWLYVNTECTNEIGSMLVWHILSSPYKVFGWQSVVSMLTPVLFW